MNIRRLAFIALLAAAGVASLQVVTAFDDDTHYAFTYYMARECGYTPLQARRMASADVSVDSVDSPATEPVGNGRSQGLAAVGISNKARVPRVAFHAFMDGTKFGSNEEGPAIAAIHTQEMVLLAMARTMRNPGVLLHFIQDEYAHAGYESLGGHWLSADAAVDTLVRSKAPGVSVAEVMRDVFPRGITLADVSLPMGSTTDYLSYRPDKSNRMVDHTVNALRDFMLAMAPRQRLRVAECSSQTMQRVLTALKKANYVLSQERQYLGKANATIGKMNAMDMVKVNQAIDVGLAGDTTPYNPTSLPYSYNSLGQPTGGLTPDEFTLYGTLTTRVRRSGLAQGAVEVSVWAKPTRVNEPAYQLDCKSVEGPSAAGGPILPAALNNLLPVGELLVRAVSRSGKIVEQSVQLAQLNQELVLDMPNEPEKPNQCGNKVAEIARTMCAATGGALLTKAAPADLDADAKFRKEAETAKDCEKKEEEKEAKQQARPTAEPQAKSGGGSGVGTAIKVAAGVGGAVTAGIFLKSALDDLAALETTGTSTSTTTTTTGGSSGSMRFVSGSFSCTYNGGGIVNSCAGSTITVNITVPMAVGSALKLSTNHIQSTGTVRSTANPPGNVTFSGFSGGGWFDQCGPPVTRLDLFNTSVSSSAVVANVTGLSLPVTCR